jgi:hypothetical protein
LRAHGEAHFSGVAVAVWPTSRVSERTGAEETTKAGRRKAVLHGIFALVGLGALTLLIRSIGLGPLLAALRASARWLPFLIALEAGRVMLEVVATLSLSPRLRRRASLSQLARIHVIGYAVSAIMPAGRAAGEAVKAAMFSRFVGGPEAAAIGTGNQSAAMIGGALAGVPVALVAFLLTGLSPLTLALVVFMLVSLVVVAAFQIACRRRDVGGALIRRFTHLEQATADFEAALQKIPLVPVTATACTLASRALFTIELAMLLYGASGHAGFGRTILALGVSLVGGAIGDMVPGQLGASDGAFALAAPLLGITAAGGVAMTMTLHVVQILWGLFGWTVPWWWKAGPTPASGGGELPAES